MFSTTVKTATIQQIYTIENPTPKFVLDHISTKAKEGYAVQAMTTCKDTMYIVFTKNIT